MEKIKLYIDSNEYVTSNRPQAIQYIAEQHPDVFEMPKSGNLVLDFCAVLGDTVDWWEFKTLEDLYGSMDRGHLAEQTIPVMAKFAHINLAIFASLDQVNAEVPDGDGIRTETIIELERNRLRGLCADLHGEGVRVHYFSENLELSAKWILSFTKNTLTGGDICTHLPRPELIQHGLLSFLPGVGGKTLGPLAKYYHMEIKPNDITSPPISEIEIPWGEGSVRRIGDKKANKIYEALRWDR